MIDERATMQVLAILWQEVAQAHFLCEPAQTDALAALERRREMVQWMLGSENRAFSDLYLCTSFSRRQEFIPLRLAA